MKKTSKRTAASTKRSPRRQPRARRPRQRAPHEAALVAFAKLARRINLRWYVFGAQAVNLHGFPRATADLDLTIDLGDRSLRDVIALLRKAGFMPRFDDEDFIAISHVIPVIHRASSLPIDLVLAGRGSNSAFSRRFNTTASIGTKSRSCRWRKLLAGRPRDLEDVEDALGQSDLRPRYRSLH